PHVVAVIVTVTGFDARNEFATTSWITYWPGTSATKLGVTEAVSFSVAALPLGVETKDQVKVSGRPCESVQVVAAAPWPHDPLPLSWTTLPVLTFSGWPALATGCVTAF